MSTSFKQTNSQSSLSGCQPKLIELNLSNHEVLKSFGKIVAVVVLLLLGLEVYILNIFWSGPTTAPFRQASHCTCRTSCWYRMKSCTCFGGRQMDRWRYWVGGRWHGTPPHTSTMFLILLELKAQKGFASTWTNKYTNVIQIQIFLKKKLKYYQRDSGFISKFSTMWCMFPQVPGT